MKYFDFTKPNEPFRKAGRLIEFKPMERWGVTMYVPTHISAGPGNTWRITLNNKQTYRKSIDEAWSELMRRLETERRPRHIPVANGPKKKLETGVIGVSVHYHRGGVVVNCQQEFNGLRRSVPTHRIAYNRLSQDWLDQALREATGCRWAFLRYKREGYKLRQPVKPEFVREDEMPPEPIQRVTVEQFREVYRDRLQ